MCGSILRFFGCYTLNDNHKKQFEEVANDENRNCTNLTWLFIFTFFLIGLLFLGFYSSKVGDPLRLFFAIDSFGNQCGMDNNPFNVTFKDQSILFPSSGMKLKNRPFIFSLDITQPFNSLWICVKSCPNITFYNINSLISYIENSRDVSICVSEFYQKQKNLTTEVFSNIGPCPHPPVYKSKSVIMRCLPEKIHKLSSVSIKNLKTFIDLEDFSRQIFYDFYAGWYIYVIVIIVSLIISLLISYSMIWNNEQIVYIFYVSTMPCGIVCSVILASILFYNFVKNFFYKTKNLELDSYLERFVFNNRTDYILLFCLTILIALFTLFSWIISWTILKPRKSLVSELFFQIRKPLKCMIWLIPETLINCLFSLVLFGLWIYILLNLLSIKEPHWHIINTTKQINYNSQLSAITAIHMKYPTWINFALVYHIFAFFWIKAFLSDAQKIFVAEATSSWYFGENQKTFWTLIYFRSFYYLFRYHLGTVAFGSFLLLFIRIPSHIFLFFFYRIAKSEKKVINRFYNYWFLWLSKVERFLRYIHSNAYIIVGANGEDFFSACKTATNLLMDNSWNLLTTNTVAKFLFFVTKITFALFIGFCVGIYFRFNSEIEYWIAPTLLSSSLAYFILNRFLLLYEMIIETMFLCYANEIDGYDTQRQLFLNDLPRKQDYGFNNYMARRIYEERLLNDSSIGFSVSLITNLSSPINNRRIIMIPNNNMNNTPILDNETNNLTFTQHMTSTPMLGVNLAIHYRN